MSKINSDRYLYALDLLKLRIVFAGQEGVEQILDKLDKHYADEYNTLWEQGYFITHLELN